MSVLGVRDLLQAAIAVRIRTVDPAYIRNLWGTEKPLLAVEEVAILRPTQDRADWDGLCTLDGRAYLSVSLDRSGPGLLDPTPLLAALVSAPVTIVPDLAVPVGTVQFEASWLVDKWADIQADTGPLTVLSGVLKAYLLKKR